MPTPTVHTLRVERTARVATLGPAAATTWWVGLHGYGQLAADFAQSLAPLAASDRYVVAPEGLSRFYVDGMDTHEQVGASWMTREARDDEIHDYVRALDATVRHLAGDDGPATLCVLGFSQGAATASRWALLGDTAVDRLVLWGGAPAHDLDLAPHAGRLRALDLTLVAGSEDPYVTDERRTAVQRRLQAHDIPATFHSFDGGHRLDAETLRALTGSS